MHQPRHALCTEGCVYSNSVLDAGSRVRSWNWSGMKCLGWKVRLGGVVIAPRVRRIRNPTPPHSRRVSIYLSISHPMTHKGAGARFLVYELVWIHRADVGACFGSCTRTLEGHGCAPWYIACVFLCAAVRGGRAGRVRDGREDGHVSINTHVAEALYWRQFY